MQAGSPGVRGRNHAKWNLWITMFSSEAVPNSSSLNEDDGSWKIGDDDDQHVLILAHFLAAVITRAAAFLWLGNKYRQRYRKWLSGCCLHDYYCLKWFTVYLLIEAESLMQARSPRVRGRNHANWNLWITTFSSEAVPNSSSLNEDDVSWKIGDDDDQHVLILAHFLAAVITWAVAFLWHGNKYRQMHARSQTEAGSSNHLYKEKPNGFSGSLTPLFVIICLLNYLLKGE